MLLCLAFISRHMHKVSWLLIIQLSFWNISLILFWLAHSSNGFLKEQHILPVTAARMRWEMSRTSCFRCFVWLNISRMIHPQRNHAYIRTHYHHHATLWWCLGVPGPLLKFDLQVIFRIPQRRWIAYANWIQVGFILVSAASWSLSRSELYK